MIHIYLCDDEAGVRRQIETALEKKILIEDYDMKIVCSAAKPTQLLDALEQTGGKGNIYFLDVDLRDLEWDGFLLGKELRQRDPHGILVYITSYGNLASRTFQYHLEAFDYIVKEPEKLEASLSSCLEAIRDRLLEECKNPRRVYTLRVGDTLRHIPLEEILFFETAPRSHHVLLHTATSCMDFLGGLNEIEAEVGTGFFRAHRSYLVALDKIEEIDLKHNKLRVGGRECLISRSAKFALMKHKE